MSILIEVVFSCILSCFLKSNVFAHMLVKQSLSKMPITPTDFTTVWIHKKQQTSALKDTMCIFPAVYFAIIIIIVRVTVSLDYWLAVESGEAVSPFQLAWTKL